MQTVKYNILPVPTFAAFGVNYAETEQLDYAPQKAVTLDGSSKETARAEIALADNESALYDITVQESGQQTLIQFCSAQGRGRLETAVTAGSGDKVKLVQVIENGGEQLVNTVKASLSANAHFELVQIYLGGADIISEVRTTLEGRASRFDAAIGYSLSGEDKLRLNVVADHIGRKSLSQIDVKGVLDGGSSKTFCGTIDFKQGASGAKGAESEEVLLMTDSVRNKTVPLILCAEEDVEGAHGASVGRIDEEQLFYMQSRGIPADEVYSLMARARLAQIISRIGDEEARRRVYHAVGSDTDE